MKYISVPISEIDELRDESVKMLVRVEGVVAEREKLRAFARGVIALMRDGGDAFDIQDLAEKHGLLKEVKVAAPCGEDCRCEMDGADFPADCLRSTALLTGEEK